MSSEDDKFFPSDYDEYYYYCRISIVEKAKEKYIKDTSKNLSFQQKSCPEIGSYLKSSSKMVNEYAFRAV